MPFPPYEPQEGWDDAQPSVGWGAGPPGSSGAPASPFGGQQEAAGNLQRTPGGKSGGGIPPWVIAVVATATVALIAFLLFQDKGSESNVAASDKTPGASESIDGGDESAVEVSVPNILGLTEEEAISRLQAAGFLVGEISTEESRTKKAGTVLSQSPPGGNRIAIGTAISLIVAINNQVRVPDVIGQSRESALRTFANTGIEVGKITKENSEESLGTVLKQSKKSGDIVKKGTVVDLVISNGKSQVPDIAGLSAKDAETVLANSGFEISIVKRGSSSSNVVLASDPKGGDYAVRGSAVTVYLPKTVTPLPSPTPTPTEDPICNSLYFYVEIEKVAKELGVEFQGVTEYKCSGQWAVVNGAFGPNRDDPIIETIVLRRQGEGWERYSTDRACAVPSPLPGDLYRMACAP